MITVVSTFVVFLRAINLGARRRFPKDEIVRATTEAGFSDVATHINTGNVLVRTARRSRSGVESALESAFLADRGFEVPVVAFTTTEVRELVGTLDEVAAAMPDLGRHYVSLLKQPPTEEACRAAEAASTDEERLVVRGRAAHLLMAERDSYHKATMTNDWVERRLGLATNRHAKVLRDIAAKWC